MPGPPGRDNPLSSIRFARKQGVLERTPSGNDIPKRPDIFPPFPKNIRHVRHGATKDDKFVWEPWVVMH
jgi:hypothetical protein